MTEGRDEASLTGMRPVYICARSPCSDGYGQKPVREFARRASARDRGSDERKFFEDDDHLWAVSGPFLSSYKYKHAILSAVTST